MDLGELFLGKWRRGRVGTVDEGGEGVVELGDGGWGEMDGGCDGVGEGHGEYRAKWQASGSEQYRYAIRYCSFNGHPSWKTRMDPRQVDPLG